jgi:hypothetical protein
VTALSSNTFSSPNKLVTCHFLGDLVRVQVGIEHNDTKRKHIRDIGVVKQTCRLGLLEKSFAKRFHHAINILCFGRQSKLGQKQSQRFIQRAHRGKISHPQVCIPYRLIKLILFRWAIAQIITNQCLVESWRATDSGVNSDGNNSISCAYDIQFLWSVLNFPRPTHSVFCPFAFVRSRAVWSHASC